MRSATRGARSAPILVRPVVAPPSLGWPSVNLSADVQLAISFCVIALQQGLVCSACSTTSTASGAGASRKHARPVVWMQRLLLQMTLGIVLAIDRALRPKGSYEKRRDIVKWGRSSVRAAHASDRVELTLCGLSDAHALSPVEPTLHWGERGENWGARGKDEERSRIVPAAALRGVQARFRVNRV